MPKLINRYGVVDKAGTDRGSNTPATPAPSRSALVLLPLTEFREFAGTWQNTLATTVALGVKLTPPMIRH